MLFAGTVILGFDTDFTKPVFGWDYFHGNFYLAYKEVLNLLGTALVAAAAPDPLVHLPVLRPPERLVVAADPFQRGPAEHAEVDGVGRPPG